MRTKNSNWKFIIHFKIYTHIELNHVRVPHDELAPVSAANNIISMQREREWLVSRAHHTKFKQFWIKRRLFSNDSSGAWRCRHVIAVRCGRDSWNLWNIVRSRTRTTLAHIERAIAAASRIRVRIFTKQRFRMACTWCETHPFVVWKISNKNYDFRRSEGEVQLLMRPSIRSSAPFLPRMVQEDCEPNTGNFVCAKCVKYHNWDERCQREEKRKVVKRGKKQQQKSVFEEIDLRKTHSLNWCELQCVCLCVCLLALSRFGKGAFLVWKRFHTRREMKFIFY